MMELVGQVNHEAHEGHEEQLELPIRGEGCPCCTASCPSWLMQGVQGPTASRYTASISAAFRSQVK